MSQKAKSRQCLLTEAICRKRPTALWNTLRGFPMHREIPQGSTEVAKGYVGCTMERCTLREVGGEI